MLRSQLAIRPGRLKTRARPASRAARGAVLFCSVYFVVSATTALQTGDAGAEAASSELAAETVVDSSLQAMMFEVPTGAGPNGIQPLPAELSRVPPSLAGRWTDGYLDLDLDVKKQLARVDEGPWEAFQIKDLSGKMMVFTIGQEQYIGLHDRDDLTITRFSDRTRRALMRSPFRPTLRL